MAEIVLRLCPVEGRPRTGALLERLGVSGHGLLKVRCPVLPRAQGRFEFLVLTAARSGEVRLATWDEMDLDAAVWTIPAARDRLPPPPGP